MAKKPVMLCIMDGFGWTPDETYGNAVVAANKPHLDALMKNYPMTTINASGMAGGVASGACRMARWATLKLAIPTWVLAASCTSSSP